MQGLFMKYFVLRPGKDDKHGEASRQAITVYANEIEEENPTLAQDLREWVRRIQEDIAIDRGG